MIIQSNKKKSNFVSAIIILVAVILLSYTAYDAFKIRPELNEKVKEVNVEFSQLKVYLDDKLPQIDSLLIIHTELIQEQNGQLKELNKLSTVLQESK